MEQAHEETTFLFTDIEGSSRLWEAHPRAMAPALARHDAILREIFSENRGDIFKTIGDGFCVALKNAHLALAAALNAQRALAKETWSETGPLRVRMALHSGAAERREHDYFGPPLNRVARVLAAGHGGQTLLSHVTAERVRDKLPADVSLRDLGERRLRDLSQPERIFQLVAPDLPSDFPPLRSLEVLPNNLPAQLTTFLGRERAMVEVKQLLEASRLITLTGAGGTGKTRLSLQVAADVLENFPHGVWLIELATLSDAALLPATVAAVLDVREEPTRPLLTTMLDSLRQKKLLLLLDNCEHLVAACARFAETLLRQCPELRILASSREPLGVAGETTWTVPSLATPELRRDQPARLDVSKVAEFAAVELFVERAAAVRPTFVLSAENADAIARICWRLDGIPLAIELAAARIKVLTPQQILARLDDRFRLLSAGTRTAVPRQQTLSALIDWSYDLLSEKERALLRRLSVFVRGRSLEMVEDVCSGNGLEESEVLDLLTSLVDKSLVSAERGPDGESRYYLLESVWDYSHEKLAEAGETQLFRDRHLDYFLKMAEDLDEVLIGPRQVEALETLELENANLRSAFRWSIKSNAAEKGMRLAAAMTRYGEIRSVLHEASEQFEKLFALPGAGTRDAVRANALQGAGRIAWCQDRGDAALGFYREAFQIYQELGMKLQAGLVLVLIGFVERADGHLASAHSHFDQGYGIAKDLNNDRLLATALSGLGSVAADEGDLAAARAMKERSLIMYRQFGDKWVIGLISWSVGRVALAQHDDSAAHGFFAECIAISRELGNRWLIAYALEGFGDIAIERGEPARAARLYGAAEVVREEMGLSLPPTERLAYDGSVARMREKMSPESFAIEWATGRRLSDEEASGRESLPSQDAGALVTPG